MSFVPAETSEEALRLSIEALGYRVESVHGNASSTTDKARTFAVPAQAPAFFLDAVKRARARRTPLIIVFGATWCAPCQRLKSETLENVSIARLLAEVELVTVNLGEEPKLGQFYGVSSIPCVVFVDTREEIVDRLLGFEPPEMFANRLRKVLR